MDFVSIDESKVIVHHLLLLRRLCAWSARHWMYGTENRPLLWVRSLLQDSHLACAVDAVHSDAWSSRHAAKHRQSQFCCVAGSAFPPADAFNVCMCFLNCFPDLDAAHETGQGSEATRTTPDKVLQGSPNLMYCSTAYIIMLKQDIFWAHGNHKGSRDPHSSLSDAFCIASAFPFVHAYEANKCGREMWALCVPHVKAEG